MACGSPAALPAPCVWLSSAAPLPSWCCSIVEAGVAGPTAFTSTCPNGTVVIGYDVSAAVPAVPAVPVLPAVRRRAGRMPAPAVVE